MLLLATVPLEHVLVLGAILFAIGSVSGAVKAQRDRRTDGDRADAERRECDAAGVLALRRLAATARRPGVRHLRDHCRGGGGSGRAGARGGVYRHRETVNIDEIDVLRW